MHLGENPFDEVEQKFRETRPDAGELELIAIIRFE